MKQKIQETAFAHSRKTVLLAMLTLLLGMGAVGEVAAMAPDCAANEFGGQFFKNCEDHATLIKR